MIPAGGWTTRTTTRWRRRTPWLLAALALLFTGGAATTWILTRTPEEPPAPAPTASAGVTPYERFEKLARERDAEAAAAAAAAARERSATDSLLLLMMAQGGQSGSSLSFDDLLALLTLRKEDPAARGFARDFMSDPQLKALWEEAKRRKDLAWLVKALRSSGAFGNLVARYAGDPGFRSLAQSLGLDPRFSALIKSLEGGGSESGWASMRQHSLNTPYGDSARLSEKRSNTYSTHGVGRYGSIPSIGAGSAVTVDSPACRRDPACLNRLGGARRDVAPRPPPVFAGPTYRVPYDPYGGSSSGGSASGSSTSGGSTSGSSTGGSTSGGSTSGSSSGTYDENGSSGGSSGSSGSSSGVIEVFPPYIPPASSGSSSGGSTSSGGSSTSSSSSSGGSTSSSGSSSGSTSGSSSGTSGSSSGSSSGPVGPPGPIEGGGEGGGPEHQIQDY